jgi:signal transduction histidine kinase
MALFKSINISDKQWLIRHWFFIGVLALSWFQVLLFPGEIGYQFHPLLLALAASIYTSVKLIQPLRWYENVSAGVLLLLWDLAFCAILIFLSGEIHSPFILYSLTPVLTAAILLTRIHTLVITLITFGYIFASFLVHPTASLITLGEINNLVVLLLAIALTAALPYFMNVKDSQNMKLNAVLSERQKLAREIHDSLCQSVYGLRWQIQTLRSGTMPIDKASADEKISALLDQIEADARNLISTLRGFKSGCSLVSELKAYLNRFEEESGITYVVEEEGQIDDIDDIIKGEVLHICEEALRNTIKHSKCHHIVLKIANSSRNLRISVSDNGCGFASTQYLEGRGLMVMRERAESVGGHLEIWSNRGNGTEIKLEVPRRCPSGALLTS